MINSLGCVCARFFFLVLLGNEKHTTSGAAEAQGGLHHEDRVVLMNVTGDGTDHHSYVEEAPLIVPRGVQSNGHGRIHVSISRQVCMCW